MFLTSPATQQYRRRALLEFLFRLGFNVPENRRSLGFSVPPPSPVSRTTKRHEKRTPSELDASSVDSYEVERDKWRKAVKNIDEVDPARRDFKVPSLVLAAQDL